MKSPLIQIIDYGAGNLRSVKNALNKLGVNCEIVSSPKQLKDSAKIIFPGVGAASSAMENLRKSGFAKIIPQIKNPFLGICLGMQVLTDFSEEGDTKCLGIIKGKVKKFTGSVRVPQIGWNKVMFAKKTPLFKGISSLCHPRACLSGLAYRQAGRQESGDLGSNQSQPYFYFVNSYHVDVNPKYILATTNYGVNFASVIQKDNFYGTQFHPEKSGEIGLALLNNFCKLC